jgi:hypothetical protein
VKAKHQSKTRLNEKKVANEKKRWLVVAETSLPKILLNKNGLIRKNKTPKAPRSLLFSEPSYFSGS